MAAIDPLRTLASELPSSDDAGMGGEVLVRLDRPLADIEAELSAFPWDWDAPELVAVGRADVVAILERRAADQLTDGDVEQWANLVEGREDIEFTPEAGDAIALLANPAINGSLSEVGPMLLLRLR